MDAYLEKNFITIFTYCIQNPNASEIEAKANKVEELAKMLSHMALGGIVYLKNRSIER